MGGYERDPKGDYGHAAGRAGGGTVLIDSDEGPLLAIAPRETFEDLVLGMVLVEERAAADGSLAVYRNTDWPWRVSFASFIFNLLNDRAAARTWRPRVPTGQERSVTLDAPDARTGLDVQMPSGHTIQLPPSPSGKLMFTDTEEWEFIGFLRAENGASIRRQPARPGREQYPPVRPIRPSRSAMWKWPARLAGWRDTMKYGGNWSLPGWRSRCWNG